MRAARQATRITARLTHHAHSLKCSAVRHKLPRTISEDFMRAARQATRITARLTHSSAVQCSAVQCSAVQCSAVRHKPPRTISEDFMRATRQATRITARLTHPSAVQSGTNCLAPSARTSCALHYSRIITWPTRSAARITLPRCSEGLVLDMIISAPPDARAVPPGLLCPAAARASGTRQDSRSTTWHTRSAARSALPRRSEGFRHSTR
jgi:hypothetical protein